MVSDSVVASIEDLALERSGWEFLRPGKVGRSASAVPEIFRQQRCLMSGILNQNCEQKKRVHTLGKGD